jgi:transcriptional regulator with XRE-family HTH domain
MTRSYRNQGFATHRQNEARDLIDEYVESGFTIQRISEKTGIATSTISSWFRDAHPNPRTLRKLKLIKSEIDRENKLREHEIECEKWIAKGGFSLVDEYQELRNKKPPYSEVEEERFMFLMRHESDGFFLGLVKRY